MKTLTLSVIGLMCALLCSVVNGSDVVNKAARQQKPFASNGKKISNLLKRSEYYKKKAEQESDKEIADIYTKCAAAKQKMAEGYTGITENSNKVQKIFSSNPELRSILNGKENKKNKLEGKKRIQMRSRIKVIQKCASMCNEKGRKAGQAGNNELQQEYSELALAMQAKGEALKLVSQGKKEFKNSRKELNVLRVKAKEKALK